MLGVARSLATQSLRASPSRGRIAIGKMVVGRAVRLGRHTATDGVVDHLLETPDLGRHDLESYEAASKMTFHGPTSPPRVREPSMSITLSPSSRAREGVPFGFFSHSRYMVAARKKQTVRKLANGSDLSFGHSPDRGLVRLARQFLVVSERPWQSGRHRAPSTHPVRKSERDQLASSVRPHPSIPRLRSGRRDPNPRHAPPRGK